MIRSIPAALAVAAAAVAFAACGSSGDGGGAKVAPETVKTSIERAAHVKLEAEALPADAREQGMTASYTNSATVGQDKQAVAVFVMKDADLASKVTDRVRASAPKSARLIAHGRVMVVYAAAGTDRAAAVERAVDAL